MEDWLYNLIGYALYVVVGIISAFFVYFILNRKVLGRFGVAIIMGIIGSIFGGFLLDDVFKKLTDIYNVNVLAALFLSIILIWLYSTVAPGGKKKW